MNRNHSRKKRGQPLKIKKRQSAATRKNGHSYTTDNYIQT